MHLSGKALTGTNGQGDAIAGGGGLLTQTPRLSERGSQSSVPVKRGGGLVVVLMMI